MMINNHFSFIFYFCKKTNGHIRNVELVCDLSYTKYRISILTTPALMKQEKF